MPVIIANNVATTLAANINASVTSLTLTSAAGWPGIFTGDHLYATIDDGAGGVEIVRATARVGTTLTIERGRDGTAGRNFAAGAAVEMRLCRAALQEVASNAGITLDQARDAAGALLATLPAFTYNATTNALTLGLRDADIPAGLARLANATFIRVKGPSPQAADDLATKAYVDGAVSGVAPRPTDHFLMGLSADATPNAAEATIPANNGIGDLPAFTNMHILVFRLATEPDITTALFSDDDSNTNQIGAFTKFGSNVTVSGAAYKVWVGNRAITVPSPGVTLTVR